MPSDRAAPPFRLSPGEYAFLALVTLGWAAFTVSLGKDTSWDFRNYHWYIPYAFLNGRLGFDVAVAHQATYYNPLMDVPFYWLAVHTRSWIAIAVLGLFQGANVVPLYVIARESLDIQERKLAAAALAVLGQTGGITLVLYGTHYYDNVMSLFVLTGLAILIANRERLIADALPRAALLCAIAGFLTGCAAGLKLPEAPFALGFAAALLALGGDAKHQGARLLGGGIGGALGFALCAGFWMLKMAHLTGNPLFPYFNQIFHSPLALGAAYRDMRFLPRHVWTAIGFPFLFSADWSVADDIPFRDMRVGLAYIGVIAAAAVWLIGRRSKAPLVAPAPARVMFAFAAVSYVAWIEIFAIYRYITLIEMLAPLLIAAAVGLLPLKRRTQLVALGAIFLVMTLYTRGDSVGHAGLGDPYIKTTLPPPADPAHTMVLMTGEAPLGFIATTLPPEIPVLRIDGWMVRPEDDTLLTREMRARVAAHRGPLFLIADAYDMHRAHDALARYGLSIDWRRCRPFDTNLMGAYLWCPLMRHPPAPHRP